MYISCNFSDVVVELLGVLRMASYRRTHEEKLQERRSRQLVAQIYTVWTFIYLVIVVFIQRE